MNPFHRRDLLRGFGALAGTTLLPSLPRLAFAQEPSASPPAAPAIPPKPQIARGRVLLEGSKKGVPNVRVSNGLEIVATDAQGRYQLPIEGDAIIFIQKPSGYRVPLNDLNQPKFYYIHKPQGTQLKMRYPGIAPTGELPASIDFTLIKQDEPDDFRVVLWADPQVRNIKEVDYVARDVAAELKGVDAAFGMSLGDNVFNTLQNFRPLQDVVASLGVPWHSVIGNHDLNFEAPDESLSGETFKSFYGPTDYSFDYGQVHFVALDNVLWHGADPAKGHGNYTRGFTAQQLAWLKNDLAGVPSEKLVVLFMHIPIIPTPLNGAPAAPVPGADDDRLALFELLKDHPHTLSISGHTHINCHAFLDAGYGWPGKNPHHHFNCGTVSGSWWCGYPDEQGIPHTTMRDGAPNGYAFLNIKKHDYTIDWRSARSSPDYQMSVIVPPQIDAAKIGAAKLQVNVFNGSAKTRVEARFSEGAWTAMEQTYTLDPNYDNFKAMEAFVPAFAPNATEEQKKNAPWIGLPAKENSAHLWQLSLPALPKGPHWIEIRATDHWNRTFEEKRLIQVV